MSLDLLGSEVNGAKLATVIGLYALGDLTLGEAAEQVGVSKVQMQEILNEAGVELRLGSETREDARSEVNVARRANR